MKKYLLFFTVIFLVTSNRSFCQCDNVLNSIYDYRLTNQQHELSKAFINWYKGSQSNSSSSSSNLSGSAFVPVGEVMTKMGFDNSKSSRAQFNRKVETYESLNYQEKERFDEAVASINTDVIKAWESCINSGGVHLWIKTTADPAVFILGGKYIDQGYRRVPKIQMLDFSEPVTTASKSDGHFLKANGQKLSPNLSATPKEQTFRRANKKSLTVTFEADMGGNNAARTFILPAIQEYKEITVDHQDTVALLKPDIRGRMEVKYWPGMGENFVLPIPDKWDRGSWYSVPFELSTSLNDNEVFDMQAIYVPLDGAVVTKNDKTKLLRTQKGGKVYLAITLGLYKEPTKKHSGYCIVRYKTKERVAVR